MTHPEQTPAEAKREAERAVREQKSRWPEIRSVTSRLLAHKVENNFGRRIEEALIEAKR